VNLVSNALQTNMNYVVIQYANVFVTSLGSRFKNLFGNHVKLTILF